jgi:predicted DNA-binding transcriptional regulator AlpA
MMTTHNDLTVAQTAREVGLTKARLYQLIDAGSLPVRRVKVAREEIRVPQASVEELRARRAVQAAGR